jgi:indolepyruvate ferredoxin oxidoreductase, alpha subunit
MNITKVLTGKEGEKLFLLGNEAAVRGTIEAGVAVASTYPGTPSSEIGDVLFKLAKDAGMYFEFSTNEKVALEVSAAAAASGLRSFTFMKHVGLNVAADSFMSTVYEGVNGGMIILSADDPSIFSSQNEQDNRHYARIANIPTVEPSNPQEIKDMMKYGYELSEEFQIPILMRTTTRVSHMRGVVELEKPNTCEKIGYFKKDPKRFVPVPVNAREMHRVLVEKIEKIRDVASNSPFNQIFNKGGKIGVITSGSAFNYTVDAVEENDLSVNILKLGFSYPFPEKLVHDFIKELDSVIVIEEVDPIMENEVLAVIGKYGLQTKVHGKLDETLPLIYEYTPDIVLEGIKKVVDVNLKEKQSYEPEIALPVRPPTLCPGCPHRAAYYTAKKAVEELDLDAVYPNDIGCYTLGLESPYEMADYLLSMGSSVGTSCGFSKSTDQSVVSFIGDSTFFHAGIPPLINAVHNKDKFVLVILDNRTTAMTGGQPNPGLPVDGMGEAAPEISIEKIVKAVGVEFLEVINPVSIDISKEIFKKALQFDGVAVVISKYPCMLTKKSAANKLLMNVDTEKCDKCLNCLSELTCPAIYISEDGSVDIDSMFCKGCSVCMQICPKKAIGAKRIIE